MAVIVVVPNPDTETGLPRIAASLVSSLRAVRGQVPAADRIEVVEFADLRARLEPAQAPPVPRQALADPWARQPCPTAAETAAEPVQRAPGVPGVQRAQRAQEPAEAAQRVHGAQEPAGAAGVGVGAARGAGDAGVEHPSPVGPVVDSVRNEADSGIEDGAGDSAAAVAQDIERRLLEGWWRAAVRTGQGRGAPEDLPRALAETAHFAHQQRPPAATARELRRYLTDRKFRHELRDRTQACIGPETRVVVGHSLGGLIAYEALCAAGDSVAVTLVTLGPALCGPSVVFDLLDPAPRSNQGEWPAAVRHWFNIVAHTDLTALCQEKLTARFGPGIEDLVIEPRAITESLTGYLLDRSTGLAVATGLATEFR